VSTQAEASSAGLPLTGERTVPGIPRENYWFRRHEAAYRELVPYCAGAVVLDAGCGEGYGADAIAGRAALVLALDYDPSSVAHVARAYPAVRGVRGNLAALPVGSSTVDVVANLQVLEHLWDQPGFLAECHRVLRPGGTLLLTTPNRLTFSPGRDTPLNPFHTKEFTAAELAGLLTEAGFDVVRMAGLRHARRLTEVEAELGGSIINAQVELAVAGREWPPTLAAAVAAVTADDFVIAETDVDASLDLVAVAARRPAAAR